MHSAYLSDPFFNFSDRETSTNKPHNRGYPQEAHNFEDNDKFYSNFSKAGPSLDPTNFGFFFNNKPINPKSSNDNHTNRNHKKKKSYETSSSRDNTMKRMPSKDYSNLEELYDNSSAIFNPSDFKFPQQPKKLSNEIPLSKFSNEGGLNAVLQELSMPAYTERAEPRNGMKGGNNIPRPKNYKEERQDQSIIGTLSKLDLYGESEDQKAHTASRDMRLHKGNFNTEVIERIMSKALHHRRVSGLNNNFDNTSNLNASSHNLNITQHIQSEVRNNNNSVFNGSRKNKKGTNTVQYQNKKEVPVFNNYSQDPFRHSPPNVMFSPFQSNRDFSNSNVGSQPERFLQVIFSL